MNTDYRRRAPSLKFYINAEVFRTEMTFFPKIYYSENIFYKCSKVTIFKTIIVKLYIELIHNLPPTTQHTTDDIYYIIHYITYFPAPLRSCLKDEFVIGAVCYYADY